MSYLVRKIDFPKYFGQNLEIVNICHYTKFQILSVFEKQDIYLLLFLDHPRNLGRRHKNAEKERFPF